MKSVVVDLSKLGFLNCGLGQFSLRLGDALVNMDAEDDQVELIPLLPSRTTDPVTSPTRRRLMTSLWRRKSMHDVLGWLPSAARRRFDLWHMTHQGTPYWPAHADTPVVLTAHDLNFLHQKKSPRSSAKHRARVQANLDRAQEIVAVSHYTAEQLQEHMNLRGRDVHVIYNGADADDVRPRRPQFMPARHGKFFFWIGDIIPHKNVHSLIDLMLRWPGHQLIIAGRAKNEYAQFLRRRIDDSRQSDRVLLSGEVSDAERNWLYQHAEAFLFPSCAEGFGLPVIEAMSYGTPVFLSTKTSLPEVGGPLAFYWRNFRTDDMHQVLADGLQEVESSEDYGAQLRDYAARFNWRAAASQYWDLYRETMRLARLAESTTSVQTTRQPAAA